MGNFFLAILLSALVFGAKPLLAQPVITGQPTNLIVVNGNNAVFSVMATGIGPLTYQWRLNGTNIFTNGIITTVAGNGNTSFSGDGGTATNAAIRGPYSMAMDIMGNLLIADTANNRIRKVDTNGIISTIAGNGTSGFSGDGGAATNAGLYQPKGVACDDSGNFFVADGNERIRMVDANGIITTVAGNGSLSYSGDGGKATNAGIGNVTGVAVDVAGNVFICALGAINRVRKVDTNGIISTVAGNGSTGNTGDGGMATNATLYSPFGVALDGYGNLYISSSYSIRKVDTNGVISTVAGTGSGGFSSGDGGQATNAVISSAQGICVDEFGWIYIADNAAYRIRRVDDNGIITTVAGIGSGGGPVGDGKYATNASVYAPEGVALDSSGNMLIADTANNRIRKVFTGRDPVLRLNSVTAKDVGNYQVIVTGADGSVTSSVVSLTVPLPPAIVTQPNFLTVPYGGTANFNVSVTNYPPFGYQWFTSSGRVATAEPFVSGGSVQFAFVLDPGAGYVSTPLVRFVGGSGSGAAATATMISGSVVQINMVNHGSGYTAAPPTVQIDPPPTINTALLDQTNATLTIPSVTDADSTNYFVVVTNNYGSVTSSTIFLRVFLPPQNLTVKNLETGMQLQFAGTPYYPYSLQSATNLTPPIYWKSLVTNYADVGGIWSFTVTNWMDIPGRFYRAVGQ